VSGTDRELVWLRRVGELSRRLAGEEELTRLLPLVLEAALELTEAERGYLVRVDGEKPDGGLRCRVEAALGFNKTALRGRAGDVSRTVVERVLDAGEGLVTTREADADVLDASSVQARRVLSIACAPLRLRGRLAGVLYLDHRFARDAFREEDLAALQTFADQAALAIETAELRADRDRLSSSLQELEALRRQTGGAGDAARPEPEPDRPAPARRFPLQFGGLVGASPAMLEVFAEVERAARTWDPVLVQGEAGTGKELVAREIHDRSELPAQPFLVVSCAAVDEEALDRELFGDAGRSPRATPTGALARAERGTLVLQEVADLPPALQAKLGAVLRDRFLPGGGASSGRVACRVVGTTVHDLRALAAEGGFREDLFYRLDVQRIAVPPLRARREDVAPLTDHFAELLGGRRPELTGEARRLLADYGWPGNVLELRNEVKRLLALDVERIGRAQLSEEVRSGRTAAGAQAYAGKTLGEVEREMVRAALAAANGNKAEAARRLGVPRSSLYGLLERHGLG